MNIKQFVFQDENDMEKLCNVVTIINNEENNSLYLVYVEEGKADELLFAKMDISSSNIFLENITSYEEVKMIEKKLNERINSYE